MLGHASLDLYHFTRDCAWMPLSTIWCHAAQAQSRKVRTSKHTSCAFVLNDMQVRFVYKDTLVALQTLRIQLPKSELKAHGEVLFNRQVSALNSQLSTLNFSLSIDNAVLCPKDIAFLVPALAKMDKPVRMVTALDGRDDSLRCAVGSVERHKAHLRGNGAVSNSRAILGRMPMHLGMLDLSLLPRYDNRTFGSCR